MTDDPPEWVIANIKSLAQELGITYRQLQYMLDKKFETRGGGSGNSPWVRISDMKMIRITARLIGAGFAQPQALLIAGQMRDTNQNYADLPNNIRVELKDAS